LDRSFIYMCALRARGLAPSRVFLLYRTDNRLPTPPRTAPSWVSAGVLANDSIWHGSAKQQICRRRAVASRPKITNFVFHLHHQDRLLFRVFLANVMHQLSKRATIASPGLH